MANKEKSYEKQQQIGLLLKKARDNRASFPSVQSIMPPDALPNGYTEEDFDRAIAQLVLFGVHDWYIGRLDLPPETKVDWNGLWCRSRWIEATGHLSHPDVDQIVKDVNECMGAAILAALAAGVFTSLPGAIAAFKASLIACLKSKGVSWADEISIWISVDQRTGDWHHCLK